MTRTTSYLNMEIIIIAETDIDIIQRSINRKTKAEKSEPKETGTKKSEAKELSGMSIVGNDEAPKSLYIVPWKSSELGIEADLTMFLNEGEVPVDRDVFKRQLDFYQISTAE